MPPCRRGVLVYASSTATGADTRALREAGFDVVLCKEGSRVSYIQEGKPITWRPSIFLIDLMLPDVSGFELCRRLTGTIARTVPVILASEYVGAEDKLEAFAAGAAGLIKKPLELRELDDILEKERIRRLKAEIGDLILSKTS